MTVTNAELAEIVAKASFLFERLEKPLASEFSTIDEKLVNARLSRWCQHIARGNWEIFHKRLSWDDLQVDKIAPALGGLPIVDSENLPAWAHTLREVIQMTQGANSFLTSQAGFVDEKPTNVDLNSPPFEDVLLPVMGVARQKLLARLGASELSADSLPLEVLSWESYLSLERSFLEKLLEICKKPFELEVARLLPLGEGLLKLLGMPDREGMNAIAYYKLFVERIFQYGMLGFFQKYPVLARTIATAVDFWVEATAEFVERLKADLGEIQRLFVENSAEKTFLGKVVKVEPYLSDFHHQNRCVTAIAFESGLQLVYKPKGLGIEAAFAEFLGWCNRAGVPLAFKVIKVCDRATYGWVEYVEHLPVENRAAAQRFYQRAGMLLCLLYALRVVDCHRENLIACGEHFVLIDMETLMHHEAKPMAEEGEETEADMAIARLFWDSVLRTGLLPRWDFSKNEQFAYDISALGAYEPSGSKIPSHVPFLNGVALSPNDYLDDIAIGFEQMYRFLLEKREILLGEDSPLSKMRSQRVRFLFRPTKVYGVVLKKSLAPEFLRDGVARSIALDFLSRAFLPIPNKPHAWPILRAELQAMEQLDIPYFGAFPDSDTLSVGLEKPLKNYFEAPSYQQVKAKLESLDEPDLSRQIEIIKASFYARIFRKAGEIDRAQNLSANLAFIGEEENVSLSPINPLNREQLLQEATRIAREIQERAIRGSDGSVKWIGFGYIPNAERFQLMPLNDNLYSGNSGIALFLAALDYIKGDREFRDVALGALHGIRRDVRSGDPHVAQMLMRQGIGGATGLSSIIYSLVKIGQFLQEPELLEDAKLLANLISHEAIASDRAFDITNGAAGAILGLLALCDRIKEADILQKAVTCGEHLRANLLSIDGAPRAWKILGKKQYAGFSHGAAGIAYALLRLHAVTQNNAYLQAAMEGIAYENSLFSPADSNWPDLRQDKQKGQSGFMTSWCHGAPGIGLARLGGLSSLDTDAIRRDIEISLQTTLNYTLRDVDCLCCGSFGRIEMLLVAAQRLSRPQLREIAARKATGYVASAERMGNYLFGNLPLSAFSPSFFQGTAGIGYELLRLAHPDALPSVLLWE